METILMVIFALLIFPALIILLPQKNDGRVTMNNMPGSQDEMLTDEERTATINFSKFLVEKLSVDFSDLKSGEAKIDLRPKNYNVSPGYRGVVKRNAGKRWVYYEIGEWKKTEETKEFPSQAEAYKYLASTLGLDYNLEINWVN